MKIKKNNNSENIPKPKYISARIAALTGGYSEGHLANLRSQRRGCSFFKRGRRVLYDADEFERWLTAHPVKTIDE